MKSGDAKKFTIQDLTPLLLVITECDGKVGSISGTHTQYPNLEVWQYGNGAPQPIYHYNKGTKGPAALFAPTIPIVVQ